MEIETITDLPAWIDLVRRDESPFEIVWYRHALLTVTPHSIAPRIGVVPNGYETLSVSVNHTRVLELIEDEISYVKQGLE